MNQAKSKHQGHDQTASSNTAKSDMVAAYIGLGSNLDSPVEQIHRAFVALERIPHTTMSRCSDLYQSTPMGGMEQPDYINAVAALETALGPGELLRQLHVIESEHGRVRGERWGARTLDLDLLVYGAEIIDQPDLKVPHPGVHERAFVLYPLHEIAPDLEIPGRGLVTGLLKNCPGDGLTSIPTRLYWWDTRI